MIYFLINLKLIVWLDRFNRLIDLYDLLSAAGKESFFIFDSTLYRQIDAVFMGSPLGPTLGKAFLCHYEKKYIVALLNSSLNSARGTLMTSL